MILKITNSSKLYESNNNKAIISENFNIYDESTEQLLIFLYWLLFMSIFAFVLNIYKDYILKQEKVPFSKLTVLNFITFSIVLTFVLLYKYRFYGFRTKYVIMGYVIGVMLSLLILWFLISSSVVCWNKV